MAGAAGLEPTHTGVKVPCLTNLAMPLEDNGRSGRIRTCDPLVPSQVLYQAEPRPDLTVIYYIENVEHCQHNK
ncbi:MAG: hypothetical protein H6Q68_370 [Firmicutes bacterium]|nr:hypothetical protein [Bacillota bacterium]